MKPTVHQCYDRGPAALTPHHHGDGRLYAACTDDETCTITHHTHDVAPIAQHQVSVVDRVIGWLLRKVAP